jgi:hypothetical protein
MIKMLTLLALLATAITIADALAAHGSSRTQKPMNDRATSKMSKVVNNRMNKEMSTTQKTKYTPQLDDDASKLKSASGRKGAIDYGPDIVGLQLFVRRDGSGPWSYAFDVPYPADSETSISDLSRVVYEGGIECEISGAKGDLEHWVALNIVFGGGLGRPIVMVSRRE